MKNRIPYQVWETLGSAIIASFGPSVSARNAGWYFNLFGKISCRFKINRSQKGYHFCKF